MAEIENKMLDSSFEDDIFDIDITSTDPDDPLWDKLTQHIIEGKVIPVIGPELLMVNNVNINKFIIDGLGRKLGIAKAPRSYSEIVYSPEYTEAPMVKTETSGQQNENNGTKKGQMSIDPAKLLADAKQMAGNDGVLLALIDDVNSNVRGAVGGPKYHRDRVLARDYDVYEVTFRAGELARVVVNGDDDTDLDLYIYDSNWNLITKDNDYLDYCICTWTPRWTGKFYIKIVNLGNVYNEYVLQTN